MSNFSTDCISTPPIPSLLANITACQLASNTSFCYPPNGTRICVSNTINSFPFYFPRSFYGNDSKIYLGYTLSTSITPRLNNTGNTTLLVGESLYATFGLNIPGVRNEKTLAVVMRAKAPGVSEAEVYAGPTVVLVKTAEFPSATATSRPKSDDDDDEDALTGLTGGEMAGIIVGVIVGIIALVTVCCCYGCCGCCGGRKRAGRVMGSEERERVVKEGVELMEQGGARGMRVEAPVLAGPGRDEIERVEAERARVDEEVVRDYIDPPPAYKS
ncbi:hypothetical protein HBH64_179200 [Parastagonospora nodorum]|nr:hypothetical protein HBI01_177230 [Parastagonospora nodorum]KAH4293687.1 hypothetical protein HBI02_183070 [Parastagonospora nodorum]KAH4324244.1 hypothetical protein HBI00_171540 [Parastagonospora nodorum]KAH4364978.1 hypothetical protein HBH94_159450 [Parastagonospora nodorum]KAH4457224.1 hypothetical protein HBH90_162980 [Parastagonospora nodorum]